MTTTSTPSAQDPARPRVRSQDLHHPTTAARPTPEQQPGPATLPVPGPLPVPGTLRLRPLGHESTASYLHRLADTYQLTLPQLLDGLHITTTGRHGTSTATGTTEIQLNDAAQHRLAAFSRIPLAHMHHARPHLAAGPSHSPGAQPATGAAAAGAWYPLEPYERPVQTCPACTRRSTAGATGHALAYLPDHQVLCPDHHHWSTGPRDGLDVHALPELAQAQRRHRRLLRRPGTTTTLTWAMSITTRWYDQQLYLAPRWERRLHRLQNANPQVVPAGSSWALHARPPVTYPETITLARALHQARLPDRPRTGPIPGTHPATTAFLARTAQDLGLSQLAPPTTDLLWTFIHHHPRRQPS